MPQAFADALCNMHQKDIEYAGMDDELRVRLLTQHSGGRHRGIEGSNGVACDSCRFRAMRIWEDYQRILTARRPTGR